MRLDYALMPCITYKHVDLQMILLRLKFPPVIELSNVAKSSIKHVLQLRAMTLVKVMAASCVKA